MSLCTVWLVLDGDRHWFGGRRRNVERGRRRLISAEFMSKYLALSLDTDCCECCGALVAHREPIPLKTSNLVGGVLKRQIIVVSWWCPRARRLATSVFSLRQLFGVPDPDWNIRHTRGPVKQAARLKNAAVPLEQTGLRNLKPRYA